MVAAIAEGYPQREIADAAYRFQRELDAGEREIVGVNAFADPDEVVEIPLLEVSEASLRTPARAPGADPSGARRGGGRGRTRRAPRRGPAAGLAETNLMPLIGCAAPTPRSARCAAVFREVFGEYREPVAV